MVVRMEGAKTYLLVVGAPGLSHTGRFHDLEVQHVIFGVLWVTPLGRRP